MEPFRYKAMTKSGAIVAGHIHAANIADLESRLRRLELDLIDGHRAKRHWRSSRIPRRALINFCFHLEQLVAAGVPIVDALIDLRNSIVHPQFRGVLATVVESVQGGRRLSEAMAEHPAVFDPIVVNLVRAGEDAGRLPDILGSLVATLKWQDELAAQTRSLATYPAMLFAAMTGLVLFVLVYLMPRLTGFIKGIGRELPWYTELLVDLSRFAVDNWHWLLAAPFLAFMFLQAALKRDRRIRLLLDRLKLHLPWFGRILRKAHLARFASILAVLYEAGIPVLDALRSTEKAVGNLDLARSLRRAVRSISAGDTIADAFEQAEVFPPLVIRMIRVGENTGALDRALSNVSYFFDRDVREGVAQFQAAIEPAAVVFVGAVIGWIMLSVLGPIYDLVATLGG